MSTKRINAAILGLGEMGKTHLKAAVDSPYIDKVIGYEPKEKKARQQGKELAIPATSNLDEILHNSDIHMVYIAAPNETHCELAIKAMKAGKAVLCEKPMGLTLDDAKNMLQVQKETGAFLQIGFELHYSKLYIKAKEWIEQGYIGRVLNTHCDYICSEFHLKDSWRSKSSGTLICEKLSHYLDLPRWWIQDEITEVFSMHAPNFVTYFNHPDNHQINYRFKNGAVSSLFFVMGVAAQASTKDPLLDSNGIVDNGDCLTYLVYGTKGAIETDVYRRHIRRWKFTDTRNRLKSEIVETINFTKQEGMEWFHNAYGQSIHISKLVAEGKKPETTAMDSFETMRLCFAAETSEQEKRVIKLAEL